MQQPNYPQGPPMQEMGGEGYGGGMPYYTPENTVDNLVSQIDPAQIIDNLDHSLKGEIYNKEKAVWEMNPSGKPMVNDACRGSVISYLTGLLTNNTTMSLLQEKDLSNIMESVIETITKRFIVNLEEFGFVPPGPGYERGEYCNQGTPDTARMTQVANLVYTIVFLTLSRALKGMESKKIFGSLSMTDNLNYAPQQQQGNWLSKMFGG